MTTPEQSHQNIDYGSQTKYDFRDELIDIGVEAVANHVSFTALPGLIEHYNKPVTNQMDDPQLSVLVREMTQSIFVTAIIDPSLDIDDTATSYIKQLPNSLNTVDKLVTAANFASFENDPLVEGRARRMYVRAATVMREVMSANEDEPIGVRAALMSEYLQVLDHQVMSGNHLDAGETAEEITPLSWSQYQELLATEDEIDEDHLIEDAREAVRTAAMQMPGGISSEKVQFYLRGTAEEAGYDPIESRSIAQMGEELIASGMIDAGLNILANYSTPDEKQLRTRIHPKLDEETVNQRLYNFDNSVRFMPWGRLRALQMAGEHDFVNTVLDRMNTLYPTTLEMVSGAYPHDPIEVLSHAGRIDDIVRVIKSTYTPDSTIHICHQHASYAAGYTLGYLGMEDEYQQLVMLTRDIREAHMFLHEGFKLGGFAMSSNTAVEQGVTNEQS